MNKVEKIKAEIEKRYEYWKEKESNSHSIESESRMSECNHLLSMIISLSDTEKDFGIKESVIPFGASDSELMEATYFIPQGYHAVIDGDKVIIKKGEEPVSNDLEKEIQRYYNEMDGDCRYIQTARHFARWQKQQMIDKACDWLADNYSKYIITNGLATIFSATIDFDTIRMIEDFKKAMEE